jgi:hypothetical protein
LQPQGRDTAADHTALEYHIMDTARNFNTDLANNTFAAGKVSFKEHSTHGLHTGVFCQRAFAKQLPRETGEGGENGWSECLAPFDWNGDDRCR